MALVDADLVGEAGRTDSVRELQRDDARQITLQREHRKVELQARNLGELVVAIPVVRIGVVALGHGPAAAVPVRVGAAADRFLGRGEHAILDGAQRFLVQFQLVAFGLAELGADPRQILLRCVEYRQPPACTDVADLAGRAEQALEGPQGIVFRRDRLLVAQIGHVARAVLVRGRHAQMNRGMRALLAVVLANEDVQRDLVGGGQYLADAAFMRGAAGIHVEAAQKHQIVADRAQWLRHRRQGKIVFAAARVPMRL